MLHLVFLPLFCRRSIASPTTDDPTQPRLGENVTGALIFFSYIAAALVFTGVIVADIGRRANGNVTGNFERKAHSWDTKSPASARKETKRATADDSGRRARQGLRVLFPALALASFSVLSWNMLNFLVVSYSEWAKAHDVPITFNAGSFVRIRLQSLHIWQWSMGSNLFESFAEDLLKDDKTWTYVRLALLYSYVWNVWMSFIGRQAGVPRLWTYFVLDQILPVSFAQNLFGTMLVLAPASHGHQLRPMMLTRVAVTGCYATLLLVVPYTVHTSWFLPSLFALRTVLFAPFLVDKIADTGTVIPGRRHISDIRTFNICLLTLFSICGLCSLLIAREQSSGLPKASISNYAASALTDDMVLGLGSAVVFLSLHCRDR